MVGYSEPSNTNNLSVVLQKYLWEQIGVTLQMKFQVSQDVLAAICQRLEKMVVQNSFRELKSISPEGFREINKIPRWTFIKGSLPYVIHCTALVLERRYSLGMVDQLKPFVIKLLYTLHWILLEAHTSFPIERGPVIDLSSIELFIQMCIPCLPNLHENDLTHSLANGLQLWRPLWNHLPPSATLLTAPVAVLQGNPKTSDLQASLFDIALVKTMMIENWSLYGYRWGLQYLQNYLQSILVKQGFDSENSAVMKAINKFSSRKSVSVIPDPSQYNTKRYYNDDVYKESNGNLPTSENETFQESVMNYVDKNGTLKITFIMGMINKLVQNKSLQQLSGSMLFVHSQIVEIALDDQNILKTLISHYPMLLYCQIKVMQLFGCERHCGSKGDSFRHLAHGYLKQLISADIEKAKEWFQSFVLREDVGDTLNMLHSLFAFCEITPLSHGLRTRSKSYLDSGSNLEQDQLQQQYFENQHSNEKNILEWIAPPLYQKISCTWSKDTALENMELFSLKYFLTRFLHSNYPLVFRKLVMTGLLDSFASSSKHYDEVDHRNSLQSTNSSSESPHQPSTKSHESGRAAFKTKILRMMHEQKTEQMDPPSTTLPRQMTKYHDSPANSPALSKTLPRNFQASSLGGDSPNSASSLNDINLQMKSSQLRTKWGKSTNMVGLYAGIRQLRCLLELVPPGSFPDEPIVGALLDLEAPVVARAAYILELAHFVNSCNRGQWPMINSFLSTGYLKSTTNDMLSFKVRAGKNFYRWGIAVGKKLDELINQDRTRSENETSASRESVNYLYQGDKGSVSSNCPQSLRFAACQLLKEITAYLRETHTLLIASQVTENDSPLLLHRDLSHTSSGRRQKHSIASALSKKIIEVKRRKSSVHLLTDGMRDSPNSSPSPIRHSANRRKSTPNIFGKGRSPKVSRRFSRQASRQPGEDQTYNTLLVDSEETSDFYWMNAIIEMNKSIDFLCVHSNEQCPEFCPIDQIKSCNLLMHALKMVYENGKVKEDCDKEIKTRKEDPVLAYITNQVSSFYHVPFSVLCKGVFVMDQHQLGDIVAASWEVLLYPDDKLKSMAACLFLIAGWKLEATVSNFLDKELTCTGDIDRAKAVQRFAVLWQCRNDVYRHLEECNRNALKVPFPKIEYTMPSRLIGEPPEPDLLPDAPWNPDEQAFNDLDLSDDEVSLYFYDSEKQKKMKRERRDKKLKKLKEQFPLTSVFLEDHASVEMWMPEENETDVARETAVTHGRVVQQFFPPSMSHGVLHIIRLLDDTSITTVNSHSVSDLAYSLVWKCLVEDPQTFLRRFFEKITSKNKQDDLILLLRKLLFHVPKLPGYAAHLLFNNLIGLVAFYERTNDKSNRIGCHEKIAEILPLLWQIVSSVHKLYFADLKQSLRREHVDHTLMVTANVGCVKELIVLGHGNKKESLSIMDEMTFKDLLVQMKNAFEIEGNNYWLVDKHSGLLLENNTKIRDVYVLKRGYPCPVLRIDEMSDEYAHSKRQQQAKTDKQLSLSQLLLTMSIFDVLPNKKHVMFLYSELYQQDSFPRKAIDVDFELCYGQELGKEILGLDVLYKDAWIKFISSLLSQLSDMHHFGEDAIGIFVEPINGALLLHCEDVMVLRTGIAALVNVARAYGKKFSNDGYFDILPTLFKVYSQHENNMLVKEVIEFALSQFYNLHSSPFILQMFASAAPMLMTDDMIDVTPEEQYELIPARCLFALLESLEHTIEDKLDIMSLVQGEKPIKPYDDVLEDQHVNKIDLAIRLALTIIAYRPESSRALQMMFVSSSIIPYYLKYLQSKTDAMENSDHHKKNEVKQIKALIKYIATIIEQNESLIHPYRNEGSINSDISTRNVSSRGIWGQLQNAYTSVRNWFSHAGEQEQEGDELERACIIEDGENPLVVSNVNVEEKKQLEDFYQPRTVLLTLVSEFTIQCADRYSQIRKEKENNKSTRGVNETKFSDIVDEENAFILIDVAMALLKNIFYDHYVLKNAGLQRFMLQAMPNISWSDNVEAFTVILKRLTRIFNRLLQKPEYLKFVDWDGLEILIRGIDLTLKKDKSVADVEDMRTLLHTCIKIMIGDFHPSQFDTTSYGMTSPSSPSFNTTVIKLSAKLLFTRNSIFSLRENTVPYLQNPDAVKVERFLVHWLLPLCVRMGTGRYDMPTLSGEDLDFVSNVLTDLLHLKNTEAVPHLATSAFSMLTNFTFNFGYKASSLVSPAMSQICFLGLKILLNVCYDAFGKLWKSLKATLVQYIEINESDYCLWMFLSHIVSNRSPMLIHLMPTIQKKLINVSHLPSQIQQICHRIRKDLSKPPVMSSRSHIIDSLLNELTSLAKGESQVLMEKDEPDNAESATDSPEHARKDSAEEDDKTYIKRVMTELRKSGRHRGKKAVFSPKGSIMKRKTTSPVHKERLRKTVSFQPQDKGEASQEGDSSNFNPSPTHSSSSPKRKIVARLSKRSKLRMFRRQDSAEISDDDDKESIIPKDDSSDLSSSPGQEEEELSDDSQGKLVTGSVLKEDKSAAKEPLFTDSLPDRIDLPEQTDTPKTGNEEDVDGELKPSRLSLSRSAALKRRTDVPSLKIAGLVSIGAHLLTKQDNAGDITTNESAAKQSDEVAPENNEIKDINQSPPPLSPKRALPKLPTFDEAAIVEIRRKVSMETSNLSAQS